MAHAKNAETVRPGELAFPEFLEDDDASDADGAGASELGLDGTPRAVNSAPVYDEELAFYLGTFLSESPDVLGWHALLGALARCVELDEGSVREEADGLHGELVLPGSDTRVRFSIDDEGYRITLTSGATLRALGNKASKASLSFQAVDGHVSRAYGGVQFLPKPDQTYYEDGPVGYLYATSRRRTLYRPIREEMVDDGRRVWLPPREANQELAGGDLAPASEWLRLLQGIERAHARSKS